jgi:tryptophan 7-halogenase
VFEGMGIQPGKYCPRVNNIEPAHIRHSLQTARQAIRRMVKTLPTHDEFLRSLGENSEVRGGSGGAPAGL